MSAECWPFENVGIIMIEISFSGHFLTNFSTFTWSRSCAVGVSQTAHVSLSRAFSANTQCTWEPGNVPGIFSASVVTQAAQARCINYHEFRYRFAYYELFKDFVGI